MTGIESVYVGIEPLPRELKRNGLTEQILRSDTESRLRQNGIRVFSDVEFYQKPQMPWLYIDVTPSIHEKIPIAAVSIAIEVSQTVVLPRTEQSILCSATTWQKRGVLCIELDVLEQGIRKAVKDSVDLFINDYLAANPNETEAKSKNDK